MKFSIELTQLVSQQKVSISIFQEADGSYMRVTKRYSFAEQEVIPASILVNVGYSGKTVGVKEAQLMAEWWRLAAQTAETLDRIFLTRDDLRRRISARMVSRTVTVVFEEGAE